jgi:hypothetical protein
VKWLTRVGVALVLLVGALQMRRADAGFVTNYGGDIAGPLFLYGAMRQGKTVLRYITSTTPSPAVTAVSLFLACATWEVCRS